MVLSIQLHVKVQLLNRTSQSQKPQPGLPALLATGNPDPTEISGCGQKCHQSMKSSDCETKEEAPLWWLLASVVNVVLKSGPGRSRLTRKPSCSMYVFGPRTWAQVYQTPF